MKILINNLKGYRSTNKKTKNSREEVLKNDFTT